VLEGSCQQGCLVTLLHILPANMPKCAVCKCNIWVIPECWATNAAHGHVRIMPLLVWSWQHHSPLIRAPTQIILAAHSMPPSCACDQILIVFQTGHRRQSVNLLRPPSNRAFCKLFLRRLKEIPMGSSGNPVASTWIAFQGSNILYTLKTWFMTK